MKLGLVEFMDCAHFLPGHPRCGTLHGHTYKVEVEIEGDSRSGMIMDFSDLRSILREAMSEYDHKPLNDYIDYPSVENVCILLREKISGRLPFSFRIRVYEGEGKWAEL